MQQAQHGQGQEGGQRRHVERTGGDGLNSMCWAAVFIWTGLALLAHTTGWGGGAFAWWNTWAVILAGIGGIITVCSVFRIAPGPRRRPLTGNLVLGLVLLGVGVSVLSSWNIGMVAALVLIAIGVAVLVGGLVRR